MQRALDRLAPLAPTLFEPTEGVERLAEAGVYPPLVAPMWEKWKMTLESVAAGATLRLKLTGAQKKKLRKRYTVSAEAHQEYLRGRYHWNQWTAGSFRFAFERGYERVSFNPLQARPLILREAERYLAPVPQFVFWRASAPSLYYLALDQLAGAERNAFTDDVARSLAAFGELRRFLKPLAVRVARQNGHAHLEVSDSGPGIPAGLEQRIFDPFFSTRLHRYGMGLPLLKQIVAEHMGDIQVESEAGKGTRFALFFPVRWSEPPSCDSSRPRRRWRASIICSRLVSP